MISAGTILHSFLISDVIDDFGFSCVLLSVWMDRTLLRTSSLPDAVFFTLVGHPELEGIFKLGNTILMQGMKRGMAFLL
jgi:hypothetical protein